MRSIGRSIKNFICIADGITYENGNLVAKELPILVTYKKPTNRAIEKHFKKLVGDKYTTIIVKSIKEEENFYSMEIEEFLKYAKKEEQK